MISTTPGELRLDETRGLRRMPRQQRSRERVEAILRATAELLEEVGYDEITTTAIAERADMRVSSLYQFFANVDAIVVELVRDWTREFDAIIDAAIQAPADEWIDRMIDGYADFFRTTPGFRAIYFNGALRGEARTLDRASNTALEERLAAAWTRRGERLDERLRTRARVTIHIGDALLALAFRLDPAGDAPTIAEAKRVLRLYLEGAGR